MRPIKLLPAICFTLMFCLYSSLPVNAATETQETFNKALKDFTPDQLFPGADRIGKPEGELGVAKVFSGEKNIGLLFVNSAIVNSTGYSGKPIHVMVGLDHSAVVQSVKLLKHHEPIVLIGIPEAKITALMAGYVGMDLIGVLKSTAESARFDAISGATVTIRVIKDSIIRAGIKVAREYGLGGLQATAVGPQATIDTDAPIEEKSWQQLRAEGAIQSLPITIEDINQSFITMGDKAAIARPEQGAGDEVFIDLYAAQVSVPSIGQSLLGKAQYRNLKNDLKPGQQAILLMGKGRFSFKGSGYVRGGIFDRFEVVQGDDAIRFTDLDHKRIHKVLAAGAPEDFKEVDLYITPEGNVLDPALPWDLQLLVNRETGPMKKAFVTFLLEYQIPKPYLVFEAPAAAPENTVDVLSAFDEGEPLWKQLWAEKTVEIVIMGVALIVLAGLFFFQDWITSQPGLTPRVRFAFMLFTLFFIGFYANAQLSVVNILTVFNAAATGFSWEYFLMDPLIFIIWGGVFAGLLFWGRGAYCGWLCPFGALQELTNNLAKWLKFPQWAVPWGLHERLWPIKYLIFLVLFGVSLHSLGLAEKMAEVEPFKTAIILKFIRDWPFVIFALAMLLPGLFIERFYCRYLCPLGAALAIPARLRMFVWLKRYRQCGNPCQVCHTECMVQAIHPEGEINPNECIYCMHCQERYHDDEVCPVRVKQLERDKRRGLIASDQTRGRGEAILAQIRKEKA
jgi:NosR/NirI family nitrous oxide reductase transcriptional regulator